VERVSLRRLEHQTILSGDAALAELAVEVHGYPGVAQTTSVHVDPSQRVFVPMCLNSGGRELRLLNTVTTFGTALDITVAELVIEAFYPADATTARELGGSYR
jgi:hypothetical protein